MKIFETGLYDYSDDPRVDVDKPVLYTPQFFENMLKDGVDNIPLDIEHKGEAVGVLNSISFTDNCLNAIPDTDIGDKKISPTFEYDTIDRGSYLEAVNGKFIRAGITETPRTFITNNSHSNNEKNGKGEKMVSEEAFEQITKQNQKLARELASKDNQLEANKKELERLKEIEKENEALKADNKKITEELDSIKPYADKYSAYVKEKKESLLDEITEGNDALRESFKDLDIETLAVINEQKAVNTTPQGVNSNVAEGQNEGDGSNDEEAERKERLDAVDTMFSELNTKEE
jgi:hypothetical protein